MQALKERDRSTEVDVLAGEVLSEVFDDRCQMRGLYLLPGESCLVVACEPQLSELLNEGVLLNLLLLQLVVDHVFIFLHGITSE